MTGTAASMVNVVPSKQVVFAKAAFTTSAGLTTYMTLTGVLGGAGTHASTFMPVNRPIKVGKVQARVVTNSVVNNSQVKLRKNDADTTVVATFLSGQLVGVDYTNYATYDSGDLINWQIAPGAGGGLFVNVAISAEIELI